MLHTLDTICLHDPSVGPTVLNARAYAGPLQFSFPHSAAGGLPYACDGPPVMVIRVGYILYIMYMHAYV